MGPFNLVLLPLKNREPNAWPEPFGQDQQRLEDGNPALTQLPTLTGALPVIWGNP